MNFLSASKLQKGFTLIELLVVIVILGILTVGVVAVLNPADKINLANDTKAEQDIDSVAKAIEQYAISNSGNYPYAASYSGLASVIAPTYIGIVPPAGTNYTYTYAPIKITAGVYSACGATDTCAGFYLYTTLKANANSGKDYNYDSRNSKGCFTLVANISVAATATTCL